MIVKRDHQLQHFISGHGHNINKGFEIVKDIFYAVDSATCCKWPGENWIWDSNPTRSWNTKNPVRYPASGKGICIRKVCFVWGPARRHCHLLRLHDEISQFSRVFRYLQISSVCCRSEAKRNFHPRTFGGLITFVCHGNWTARYATCLFR